jgi:2-C-methyl-D-erythritol 2,4-cyclodiphosphate synthase
LADGRKLWLGGVEIPHNKGCVGHSDADVLLHAICDAMLGALGLGDIGKHFPDTDLAYKGIDSKVLLKRSYAMVREKGYWLVNIDTTLLLQAPKISPYVEQMQKTIAYIVHLSPEDISIKATTTEHLSFIGREEGVVATANVLLQKY